STLAHCGRCAACETGRATECRNAPNPKDTQPFTVNGRPAYQFANASAFAERTVVREQSAIPVDPRVPFDRAALIGCGIMTGVGADSTFEAVGSLAVLRQALEALGPGGALTIVGVPKLGSSLEFVVHALYQNKAILGCRYGTARPRRDFPLLADLYLGGRLKIDELITQRYALEELPRALEDLQQGRLARGVFLLDRAA